MKGSKMVSYKSATIEQVEGGYVVNLDGRVVVTTSLNKAIKMIRDLLQEAGGESDE